VVSGGQDKALEARARARDADEGRRCTSLVGPRHVASGMRVRAMKETGDGERRGSRPRRPSMALGGKYVERSSCRQKRKKKGKKGWGTSHGKREKERERER
jgi:hypothetical protein